MRAQEGGKPNKRRYKTTNWRECNKALKARGSLTVWLDKDMQWFAPPTGKRGHRPRFSDAAIQFCLSIVSADGAYDTKAWPGTLSVR
jgi:hypothetical protein